MLAGLADETGERRLLESIAATADTAEETADADAREEIREKRQTIVGDAISSCYSSLAGGGLPKGKTKRS